MTSTSATAPKRPIHFCIALAHHQTPRKAPVDMAGNEDDRQVNSRRDEFLLKIKTGASRSYGPRDPLSSDEFIPLGSGPSANL
jgi:hypothetical protein